jgi:NAD-dependent SIR2 family protein deacetylase
MDETVDSIIELFHKSRKNLFVVIGTSLAVQPAASFPVPAKRKGAGLVIINRDPTPTIIWLMRWYRIRRER